MIKIHEICIIWFLRTSARFKFYYCSIGSWLESFSYRELNFPEIELHSFPNSITCAWTMHVTLHARAFGEKAGLYSIFIFFLHMFSYGFVYSFQALECLIDNHMLTCEEGRCHQNHLFLLLRFLVIDGSNILDWFWFWNLSFQIVSLFSSFVYFLKSILVSCNFMFSISRMNMSCSCISSNNNTTEEDCVPYLYFLICYWTSETSLLSSIQFGPQDGWLSSFYSCLIKKVNKNETSICPSLSIKLIKDLYILILFNVWRFTLQTLTCSVFQYDKENIVEANFGELEKERCNSNTSDLSFIHTLKTNTDLLACKAEYYHQCGEYQKCFELTSL